MEQYKRIDYVLNGKESFIVVNVNIKDEDEIKEMCFEDYVEKLKKEIKLIGGD